MERRSRIGFLGFVNYKTHPTQKTYTVFNFMSQEEADYFAELLDAEKIWYERDSDFSNDRTVYLFGVKNEVLSIAQRANYKVSAKYRKPLISNAILRYSLLAIFLLAMALAIVGYVKS